MAYVDLRERLLANSHDSNTLSFEGTPCRMWDGAVVKSKRSSNYYPRYSVRIPALAGAVRQERAHRAMFEIHYGIKLYDHHCNHRCGRTLCINPLHLEKTTHKQNMRDRDERARRREQRESKTVTKQWIVFQLRRDVRQRELLLRLQGVYLRWVRQGHHVDGPAREGRTPRG